jgi:hypothetical protein
VRLELTQHPSLWTFHNLHAESDAGRRGTKIRADTVSAWERLADVLTSRLSEIEYSHRDPSELLDDAFEKLDRNGLTEIRMSLNLADDSTLYERVAPLRAAYGISDLDRHGATLVRALILHAAEFGFNPLCEGVLSAIAWAPAGTRFDLRSAFHCITRWWHEFDPPLAYLTVAVLSPSGGSRPWPPLTRFLDAVLERHVQDDERRLSATRSLSALAISELRAAGRSGASPGAVTGRLLAAAEQLNILERRPELVSDSDARRRQELTWIALDLELDRPLDSETHEILRLITPALVGP